MNKVKLGDIAFFGNGATIPKEKGKFPAFGGNGITDFVNLYNTNDDTIIVGRVGAYCGSVNYFKGRCWITDNALFIKAKQEVDAKFLSQYLKLANLNKVRIGSSQPLITQGILSKLEIQLPDFETQTAIARVLSSLDDKIELNNKINAALEKLAKTIYEYWFVQNAEEKWERKSLRELGEFKNGANYEKANEIGERVKIVNVRDISSSSIFIQVENLDKIILPKNEIEKYLLNENDIIFARSGIPGATRLIEKTEEDVIFCGFAIRFRLNDKNLKDYLFFPLKQNEEFAKNKSGGSIMPNISQDSLKEISITIPPTKTLEKFNKIVSPLFSTIIKNRQESAHLAQLRDFLLPLLMNGQVTFNP